MAKTIKPTENELADADMFARFADSLRDRAARARNPTRKWRLRGASIRLIEASEQLRGQYDSHGDPAS